MRASVSVDVTVRISLRSGLRNRADDGGDDGDVRPDLGLASSALSFRAAAPDVEVDDSAESADGDGGVLPVSLEEPFCAGANSRRGR